ncbi:MAG: thiamine pyrophosphate-requiring protein [Proteobacteria bacterium]|nr:thiamine pyrophosphate-requiring protein [Pseudomonadota bacterium]
MSSEALLARLAVRGIDYVFANAGTDFAPIIEAISRNSGTARRLPRVVTVPHENVAMGMAHGYYRIAGKPAVVMVHVTVGTANTICGLMNMNRDDVPVLLAAGRTPITETGHIASRNRSIHWGQEAFDQGGLVREFVKWDYELRAGQPVESIIDRALDIAMSAPRGPVYLTLPREVLTDPAIPPRRNTPRPLGVVAAAPSADAIAEVAALIANAQFPLIVTSTVGRTAAAFGALATLAEEFALPVLQSEARDINLPSSHAMNLGFLPGTHLADADVVVVIDSAVPWIPKTQKLRHDAKIVHIGADPLISRYPFRAFEADLLIAGDSAAALAMLQECLAIAMKGKQAAIAARRKAVAAVRAEMRARREKLLATVRDQSPVHPAWLAHCLNQFKARDAIIVNELGVPPGILELDAPLSYIGSSTAGGLGFALGAALGAKLAAPAREVIAAVGDGSYMFGNPLPFHYVARAEKLATLTIVANNHAWHAVRQSTLDVFPDGKAAKANVMPLVELNPAPDYEKVIETCGGHGERVDNPAALLGALERVFACIRAGTPALLNVMTQNRM